jgi:predicted enzyme related to lactoylglutathione lyase
MASDDKHPGDVVWCDLTVPDAGTVRDFYRSVIGWDVAELDMGGYSDYCMNTPHDSKTVAGVCHARGVNSDLPAQWLIYVTVASLDDSMSSVRRHGGSILAGPKPMGEGRYCVIRDPAGAVMALIQN